MSTTTDTTTHDAAGPWANALLDACRVLISDGRRTSEILDRIEEIIERVDAGA